MERAGARLGSGGRAWWAALAVAVAAISWFAWVMLRSANGPLLGDYAEWTYHGVLLRDVLRGHADAGYALKNYPVSNSLTTLGLGLLMLVLPWGLAAKVWLLLGAGLGLWSAVALQRAAGAAQGWKLLLVPAAALFGGAFWFGFFNFLLGSYVAMLVAAQLLRGEVSRWTCGALLVLAFLCHMIPFGFALLLVGLYALETRRWSLLWQAVPAAVLCVWYLVGRAMHGDVDGQAGMVASVPWGTALFAVFKGNTYLKAWGFVNPTFGGADSVLLRVAGLKVFVGLFALNAVVAAGMLGLLGMAGWRATREAGGQRFFWVAVVLFVAGALVMPGAAAGISDPGGRMMQVAVWSGACVVATRRRWVRVALGTCAALLLVADCGLFRAAGDQARPMMGSTDARLPARLQEFAHVGYADRWTYYDAIAAGRMEEPIYPTAMFVKR